MTERDKREKVIKGLECCMGEGQCCGMCDNCPYNTDKMRCDLATLHQEALELLKAQGPVEPVVDIDTWKCGNCGHTLEHQELLGDNVLFHEQYNYCPDCGRPVKWE